MFTRKTTKFLKELSSNNNREWFGSHKDEYEALVRDPALEYIEQMAVPLAKISPYFVASAKKSGGSLMRVYRDTRFSKDKTPYKTNIGIQFRHTRGKDVHAPGFYLHIENGSGFIGAGIWKPESSTLGAVRSMIDENQSEWDRLCKKLLKNKEFSFGGDSLVRPPKGFSAEHPLLQDLKRKDFIVIRDLKLKEIYQKDIVKHTYGLFKQAAPLVQFICEADDLDF